MKGVPTVSRADVADFLYKAARSPEWIRRAAVITDRPRPADGFSCGERPRLAPAVPGRACPVHGDEAWALTANAAGPRHGRGGAGWPGAAVPARGGARLRGAGPLLTRTSAGSATWRCVTATR